MALVLIAQLLCVRSASNPSPLQHNPTFEETLMRSFILFTPLAVLLLGSVPAYADTVPITTLFNTGVASDGTLLPDGAIDPNYTLIASADPNFPGPNTYTLLNPMSFPFGLWVANTSNSKWIAPSPDNSANPAGGVTHIRHSSFSRILSIR